MTWLDTLQKEETSINKANKKTKPLKKTKTAPQRLASKQTLCENR